MVFTTLPSESDAEALATFGSTGIQDFTATFGRHASSEPVGAIALQVTRLESSLHGALSLLSKSYCRITDPVTARLEQGARF